MQHHIETLNMSDVSHMASCQPAQADRGSQQKAIFRQQQQRGAAAAADGAGISVQRYERSYVEV
jgi:hypothetical protein